ncbi:RNA pseudouridine synthase 1 [Linum grandiflorum]
MNSILLPAEPFFFFFCRKTSVSSALRIIPAVKMSTSGDHSQPSPDSILLQLDDYPKPLSPPLPAISKDIELARAMSASSRSSLFSLSPSHVLYEDQWLMAVNKPQGIYCESVLESVPSLLSRSNTDLGQPHSSPVEFPSPEIHLANRLDRDTSGVMVITKSHKVAAKLVKAFTEHKVTVGPNSVRGVCMQLRMSVEVCLVDPP